MVQHNLERISGEYAANVKDLPKAWQDIAAGNANIGLSCPKDYVKMAQLFWYKVVAGDLDIFTKRNNFPQNQEGFLAVLQKLAWEALEFYAEDFLVENYHYPDFNQLQNNVTDSEKMKVVHIAQDLFQEFGYDFPASFYWCHLAPLDREEVCEIVPLRFSEKDKANARAWDAILHGQKVFPIQMKIQSISSQYGLVWLHGCGCNHGLSRLGKASQSFEFDLDQSMRWTWMRDYVWTVWYEYTFFPFTPVTQFLTGNLVEFEYS